MSERLNTGYAALAIDSGDVPVQVSGVAIGEGDVTRGGSGKQTLWPKETLQEAADELQGQPLATSKNHTTDGTQPQTPSDAVIGEITWSGYKPGTGVLYEGEIDDPDIARSVENGRLEVSPLVSREVEPLEESDKADFVATAITRWRDLATVVNGAAPSNEITVGTNPMKAEALHAAVESLQDGPSLDDPVDIPERIQSKAQAALDADEEGLIPDSCGTGVGSSRAEQIANNDVQVNDLLTRGDDDRTPIPSYLNSHESDLSTDKPVSEWGEEEWSSCGNAGMARWGMEAEWFKEQANELSEARGEDTPYESMASASSNNQAEALKETAGVSFTDTATGQLDEAEIEDNHSDHYLYGEGEDKEDYSYPVVDADGTLRKGNVDAAHSLGCRGQCPSDETHTDRLRALAQEFDTIPEWATTESMADVSDVSEGTLVSWNSSGERDAYGAVQEVRTEGDEPLDSEIDGDQTINPPAALIEVHTPMDGEFEPSGTMVGHSLNTDTLTVIDSLPDPESLAEHSAPAEYEFDNPGAAMSKAQEMGLEEIHTQGEGDNTVFMPGSSHQMLLEELDMGGNDGLNESMAQSNSEETIESMNDITEDEVEVLEQHRSLENPTVVEQSEYEALNSRVETLEEMMAEKLVADTGLNEATVDAMSFEAMAKEFETDEGDFDAEALTQTPESGNPSDPDAEALSEDADMEKAEALYQDYQLMGTDGVKEDICEALGVSDFEKATEVLN